MTVLPVEKPRTIGQRLSNTWKRVVANKEKYILILPGIVWYAIFAYIPIFGLSLAFKKYVAKQGLFGSPWIGLYNFNKVFADPAFFASIVFRNSSPVFPAIMVTSTQSPLRYRAIGSPVQNRSSCTVKKGIWLSIYFS